MLAEFSTGSPGRDLPPCSGCHGTGLCSTCRGEGKRVRVWIGFFGRERREIVPCRTCLGERTCRMCWSGAAAVAAAGKGPDLS